MFDVDDALRLVIATGGSDLHLKVPAIPLIRQQGKLVPIAGTETLGPEDTERVFRGMLTNERKLEEFDTEREVDFSYGVPGVARFRVNAFYQRGSISLVCRAIPFEIKTCEELLLPEVINDPGRRGARDDPADRHHRVGQVHHAGGHDRPDEHHPVEAHRDDRGPGGVPAQRQAVDRQPARGW